MLPLQLSENECVNEKERKQKNSTFFCSRNVKKAKQQKQCKM